MRRRAVRSFERFGTFAHLRLDSRALSEQAIGREIKSAFRARRRPRRARSTVNPQRSYLAIRLFTPDPREREREDGISHSSKAKLRSCAPIWIPTIAVNRTENREALSRQTRPAVRRYQKKNNNNKCVKCFKMNCTLTAVSMKRVFVRFVPLEVNLYTKERDYPVQSVSIEIYTSIHIVFINVLYTYMFWLCILLVLIYIISFVIKHKCVSRASRSLPRD